MRRSSFRRQWQKPERRLPEVPAIPPTPRAVMYAANDEAPVLVPKDEPLRSEAYRRYVASQECFACGISGWSQAAHSNSPIHGKSKGRKASDKYLFPLCSNQPLRVGCHAALDLLIDMTRTDRRAMEEQYVERMHRKAEADGWDLETLRRNV